MFFFFLSSVNFFFKLTVSKKNLAGIPSECQTVWIVLSSNTSGLIWVQTICKGYQQTTKVATSGERVKMESLMIILVLFVLSPKKTQRKNKLCCRYSLESHRGVSNEYPQCKSLWRSGENYPTIIIKYFSTTPVYT